MALRGTRTEYAAHLNVDKSYVTKLGKQGRLVFVNDEHGRQLVDFAATDAKVRGTTDQARAGNGANAGGAAGSAAAVTDLFRKAQTQERAYSARLKELRFKKESGELVSVSEVRSAYARRIAGLRDALMQLPARLAPVLAAETDEVKVHDWLQDELYLVLEQVAK